MRPLDNGEDMKLRKLHGLSAVIVAAYAVVHIANHLAALHSVEAHIAFMDAARKVYRSRLVEWILLCAVAFQIGSGLTAVVRDWRQRSGFIPWLQAGSGGYLAYFLLNHVGAVLFGRAALGLDTNFYYAAAGLYVPPFQFYFAPYYFLAVLALFTHIGCALYWRVEQPSRRIGAVAVPATIGAAISLLIVLALAGAYYPVHIPDAYKTTFVGHP
jgi:succinate dehydrogenase/fumarate reductase cytochrome b subunit